VISAVNDKGESLQSPVLENVMAAQLSSEPTDLQMIYATYNTISFEWFDPVDNGGTPILDFEVHWNEGVDGQVFSLLQESTLGMNQYFI
jgi:hypothetical protein